jgi:hypothetical protein
MPGKPDWDEAHDPLLGGPPPDVMMKDGKSKNEDEDEPLHIITGRT